MLACLLSCYCFAVESGTEETERTEVTDVVDGDGTVFAIIGLNNKLY